MSIGASRISQQIGHSGKSSLVNISSLSNNFKVFDINNSGASKRKFQNEVQIGFMISIVIFTVFVTMITGLPLFMENKRIILS